MIIESLKSVARRIPLLRTVRKFFLKNAPEQFEGFISLENNLSHNHIWMYLRNDSYMEREFLRKGLYGDWEKESLKIWAELCKNATYILDIGANTGVFSLIAKSQHAASHVVAVEPVDLNFDILSRNIERNRFDIKAEKVALSFEEGTAKMFMLKDRLNYMTSVNDNRYEKHPEISGSHSVVEIEVPIKTYQYLKDKYSLPRIDLIKIDVEGHEVAVLKAMLDDIKKDKPTILIEVIGDENAIGLNEIFTALGYKFISIDEVNKATVVEKLWDNDHHNFLICGNDTINFLKSKKLVD